MAFPASLPDDGMIDVTVRIVVGSKIRIPVYLLNMMLVFAEGYSCICWRWSERGSLLEQQRDFFCIHFDLLYSSKFYS